MQYCITVLLNMKLNLILFSFAYILLRYRVSPLATAMSGHIRGTPGFGLGQALFEPSSIFGT